MKKNLLFVCLMMCLMFWAGFSFGQCTPDPLTDPEGNGEMSPDTLEGVENTPMSTTLTIIAPDTASVGGGTINLHHITIKSITNKPTWLSYACNPGNCEYNAGQLQCALVTGTPPTGSAGTIVMDVLVDVYVDFGVPLGVVRVATDFNSGNQLVLIIHPENIGIKESENATFDVIQNQPNPFSGQTRIGCTTGNSELLTLSVIDLLGNLVYTEQLNTQRGENYFSFTGSQLNSGVYFYTIANSENVKVTRKMVKND